MAGEIGTEMAGGHEVDVGGEEHELEAHQDSNDVAAVEHDADHAQHQQQAAEGEDVGEG